MREPGASQASRGNQRHRKIILNGGWPTIINKTIYMYPPNAVYVATGAPASGLRKDWSMPKRYGSSHNSDEYFKYWPHPTYPGSEGEERRPGYKAIQVHEITQTKFNDTHDRLYYARFSRPSLPRSYDYRSNRVTTQALLEYWYVIQHGD